MKKLMLLSTILSLYKVLFQHTQCPGNPVYRQLDFWIGEWTPLLSMEQKQAIAG